MVDMVDDQTVSQVTNLLKKGEKKITSSGAVELHS
jgi:hypothetical protein